MTESGPRKGLWALMGQPPSTAEPPAAAKLEDTVISEAPVSPLPGSAQSAPPAPELSESPAVASPLELSESIANVKPRGRSLWGLMQRGEAGSAPAETLAPEPPSPESAHGAVEMRSAFEAPVKGADRRLRQLAAPEVEIVDSDLEPAVEDEVEVETEELEIDPEYEPVFEKLPGPKLPVVPFVPPEPPPAVKSGRSSSAELCLLLGCLSLPLSLIAIYPAMWTRVPSFASGFGALILGLLAQNELFRAKGSRRGTVFAATGMLMGLFGMFAAPTIYTPLDLYGQLCNYSTSGHLRQIGMATEAYVQKHQAFPAGGLFFEIKKGREPQAQHGWMALLLPYLPEGAALAKEIDYTKPYFHPVNQFAMRNLVPTFMASGGDPTLIQGRFGPAHFAGLGGVARIADGSMAHFGVFDVNSNVSREDILDGASNTMVAGEVASKYRAWGDARNWRQIGKGLNRDPDGFGNSRKSGALFLMADGSVRLLSNDTDPKVLQALSTRDGEDKP